MRNTTFNTPGVPESFRVLVRELQSLGMNVELLKQDDLKAEGAAKKGAAKEKEPAAKE